MSEVLEEGKRFHFMLSYSSHDAAPAIRVGRLLEGQGYLLTYMGHDFADGNLWTLKMHEGVMYSERMICFLSASYHASDPCLAEWTSMVSKDIAGIDRRVLTVVIQADPENKLRPGLLETRLGCDIHGLNEQEHDRVILDMVDSARTGLRSRNPLVFAFPDNPPRPSTLNAPPWAQWVDPDWDPLGSAPSPLTDEHSLRLENLLTLSEAPSRTVLVDLPDHMIAEPLTQMAGRLPRAPAQAAYRRWYRLAELDPLKRYWDRSDVLSQLAYGPDSADPLGVIVDYVLPPDEPLETTADAVATAFLRLDRMLPRDSLVLRVWSTPWGRAVRAGAAVARAIRALGTSVDCLARSPREKQEKTDFTGAKESVVRTACDAIFERLFQDGVDPAWEHSGSDAHIGVVSAPLLVRELNEGVLPPMGEDDLLRHLRDNLRPFWGSVLAEMARGRTWPGWLSGLRVASEQASDLVTWLRAARKPPDTQLSGAARMLTIVETTVVDRLVLALPPRGDEALDAWLPLASPYVRALLGGDATRPHATASAAIAVALSGRDRGIPGDPWSPAFWAGLATAEGGIELNCALEQFPDARAMWAPATQRDMDPVAAELRAVAHHVIRPYERRR